MLQNSCYSYLCLYLKGNYVSFSTSKPFWKVPYYSVKIWMKFCTVIKNGKICELIVIWLSSGLIKACLVKAVCLCFVNVSCSIVVITNKRKCFFNKKIKQDPNLLTSDYHFWNMHFYKMSRLFGVTAKVNIRKVCNSSYWIISSATEFKESMLATVLWSNFQLLLVL